jgi:hypothetical protein
MAFVKVSSLNMRGEKGRVLAFYIALVQEIW